MNSLFDIIIITVSIAIGLKIINLCYSCIHTRTGNWLVPLINLPVATFVLKYNTLKQQVYDVVLKKNVL
ncbi:MAG: hypothetical protein FWF57_00890 [Defluviitaleaceae bacterium]|nr:hypothetical protein [Defluviitaleaceae bacterium]